MIRETTATLSSRFSVSTMHLQTKRQVASEPAEPAGGELMNTCWLLLFKPEGEVGGVTDHPQQVWRVKLLVLFGPDAADQL